MPDAPMTDDLDLATIHGVEIFKAGIWNGDPYTERDLEDMVRASREVPFRVPLKLGHTTDPAAPAVGWLANLRRVGGSLFADFVDLAQATYDAIRRRAYDNVSAEIFWDTQRNGRTFRRMLKAVALLGADIPAVDLKPIHTVLADESGEVHAYTMTLGEAEDDDKEGAMSDPKEPVTPDPKSDKITALETLVKELTAEKNALKAKAASFGTIDEQLRELRAELAAEKTETAKLAETQRQRDISAKTHACQIPAFQPYLRAIYDAVTANPERLVAFTVDNSKAPKELSAIAVLDEFVAELNTKAPKLGAAAVVVDPAKRAADYEDADAEVDRLTVDYMTKQSVKDYAAAQRAVLELPEHAELKTRYAAVRR